MKAPLTGTQLSVLGEGHSLAAEKDYCGCFTVHARIEVPLGDVASIPTPAPAAEAVLHHGGGGLEPAAPTGDDAAHVSTEEVLSWMP